MRRVIAHTIGTVMDGHGPVEHYRLCRRLFGQSRRRAARMTWAAYVENAR